VTIRAIQRGTQWFRVGEKYAKITEELKPTGWGNGGKYEIVVYRCYDKSGSVLVEIEGDSGLLILYGK